MKKIMAFFLLLLLLVSFSGCTQQASSAPELLEPVGVKLDTAVAEISDINIISLYEGEVIPKVVTVEFMVDGALDELKVLTGDKVKKGQVLMTLNSESIVNQIENLEDQIQNTTRNGNYSDRIATADIKIAQEELAIMKENGTLAETCKIKETEIEGLRAKLAQTQELRNMDLNQKREKVAELKTKLAQMQIVAPCDGQVVYTTSAKEGATIKGYTPVIAIADDSELLVTAEQISQTELQKKERIYAKIDDKEYDLTYVPYDNNEYISMVLSGQQIRSRFTVNEGVESLDSGDFAAILMIDSHKEDVLTIPINALYHDTKGYYAYKVENNARIRCDVEVGVISEIKAEIIEGLKEGDVVYVKE